MKTESYYTPEEEAMAFRAKSEAVDYFFRDAIAHYSPAQKAIVQILDIRFPLHKEVYKAHMLSTPVSVIANIYLMTQRDVRRIIKAYELNKLY